MLKLSGSTIFSFRLTLRLIIFESILQMPILNTKISLSLAVVVEIEFSYKLWSYQIITDEKLHRSDMTCALSSLP